MRVFVFRDLSWKLPPHAFRRASGRNAGINAISYDMKNPQTNPGENRDRRLGLSRLLVDAIFCLFGFRRFRSFTFLAPGLLLGGKLPRKSIFTNSEKGKHKIRVK